MTNWYEATYRAQQGLTARAHTFESVAEEYIAQILREVERGERRADQGKSEPAVIRRYFVGYFGQKHIDAVSEADLERYAEWRRTYWTEGPGKLVTHIEYERGGNVNAIQGVEAAGSPAPSDRARIKKAL